MALYAGFGFALHPVVAAWGIMRPGSVERPARGRARTSRDQVGARELDIVDGIDRAVRGSARTVDIVAMLAQPGNRLLLHGRPGYAVAKDDRIVTLGARDEESAVLVLRTMLAEAPPGETIEVNWLTSAQQWAIREVVGGRHRAAALRAGDGARHGRAALPLHPERRVRLGRGSRVVAHGADLLHR